MYSIIQIFFLLFFLSSCNQEVKECACTFEYSPVCANGINFDNKCIAKCNSATNIEIGKCSCNINSGEVCATPPMRPCSPGMMCTQAMPSPKIYTNECEALKNKAQIIRRNNCN